MRNGEKIFCCSTLAVTCCVVARKVSPSHQVMTGSGLDQSEVRTVVT